MYIVQVSHKQTIYGNVGKVHFNWFTKLEWNNNTIKNKKKKEQHSKSERNNFVIFIVHVQIPNPSFIALIHNNKYIFETINLLNYVCL